jgi:hypothetical protein
MEGASLFTPFFSEKMSYAKKKDIGACSKTRLVLGNKKSSEITPRLNTDKGYGT